ncbi:MAG: CoA transferase [Firmicutes bacterium]|nr:CoA transferase [Bacillota bacterium]
MSAFLQGVRILDLTRLLPGPFATHWLAEMGADVIKVEQPGVGDYARGDIHKPPSPMFEAINRNKKSITLDLKKPGAADLFLQLVRRADVVMESYRPGVADELGVGYAACHKANPRIVYASVTGWGQNGPYAQMAGHDINYLSIAGMMGLSRGKGGEPVLAGTQIADLNGAVEAVIGVLGALLRQQRTGEGAYLDVAMLDGAITWETALLSDYLATGKPVRAQQHALLGQFCCYNFYPTQDGKWVSLGALEPKFWAAFCAAVDKPQWRSQAFAPADGTGFHAELTGLFRSKTQAEWSELGQRADCCLFPVLEMEELFDNPQVAAREMVVRYSTPHGEAAGLRFPVVVQDAPGEGTTAPAPVRPAPGLGADTDAILAEIGVDAAQLEQLRGQGVI